MRTFAPQRCSLVNAFVKDWILPPTAANSASLPTYTARWGSSSCHGATACAAPLLTSTLHAASPPLPAQVPYTAIKCSACCSELPPLSADVLDELVDDEDEKVRLTAVCC